MIFVFAESRIFEELRINFFEQMNSADVLQL